MTLEIKYIPQEYVAQSWESCKEYIKAAMEKGNGDYSLDQIKLLVLMGQWMLLVAVDEERKIHGACTVSYINYPNDRVAFVTFIGGKLISNDVTFKQFSNILIDHGATKIQGAADQAIARLWKRFGFKERAIMVERKL